MTQTIGVWNSGFRLIIWLPLNNNKWFDRHSVAKKKKKKENKSKKQTKKKKTKNKKPKRTQQLYKYVFFPEGSKYTGKCSMYRYCTR